MSAPIADGVMAATYKLVQQAMSGQWQEVPKTIQERRDLLDKISSSARPQDQEWLSALRQAMNESDAAVAKIAATAASPAMSSASAEQQGTDAVTAVMDMLGKGG
jgi:vacuolar-type H+-ATPase subunit H